MPRSKKKRLTLKEINERERKIIFISKNIKVTLRSQKSLSAWLEKYPSGKYMI